jgi:cell division ATPase FtsA
MKGICGIEIERDKVFVSFASVKRDTLTFLEESGVDTHFRDDFLNYLKDNLGAIDKKIREREEEYSLKVEKIFVSLPWEVECRQIVEDTIPLKRKKKISNRDIFLAKKQLEDICLDWNDFCIHHIVLNYEVGGLSFREPPIGVEAKKIRLKSLLIWVKDNLHKAVETFFFNYEMSFSGFVSPLISSISLCLQETKTERQVALLNIGYEKSYVVVYKEGEFIFFESFDFSLKGIIHQIEKIFLLSFDLAKEVFRRYVSFKSIFSSQEVSIKDGDTYINISISSLTTLVKDYIKSEISQIFNKLRQEKDVKISTIFFMGRLNVKEGIGSFLKEISPFPVGELAYSKLVSSSFGCLKYGFFPYLEEIYKRRASFIKKFLDIYKEYF